MITKEYIFNCRDEIIAVADRYGAYDIRLFGSIARGEGNDSSDLDLIVNNRARIVYLRFSRCHAAF